MAFNAYTTAYYLRPSVLSTLYILFFHRGNWQYILIIHHNTYATSRFAVNTVFEIIIIYIYIYMILQQLQSVKYLTRKMYIIKLPIKYNIQDEQVKHLYFYYVTYRRLYRLLYRRRR